MSPQEVVIADAQRNGKLPGTVVNGLVSVNAKNQQV